MSTCNFCSMENFDLWAVSSEPFYGRICPDCYIETLGAEKCENCGADLSDIAPDYDADAAQCFVNDLEYRCKEENKNLKFFEISVKSGYYDGLQLYVDLTQNADNAGFTDNGPEYLENDDAHYYFDMCRSKCIRAYESEKRRVNEILSKIGADYGLDKLGIFTRFSNGETWYTKIS